jgi:hypothetical protein
MTELGEMGDRPLTDGQKTQANLTAVRASCSCTTDEMRNFTDEGGQPLYHFTHHPLLLLSCWKGWTSEMGKSGG